MDHVRIHPKFLHSNATSHKWALGGFAELLDNALHEVCTGATYANVDMLENQKDGSRMILIEHSSAYSWLINSRGFASKVKNCTSQIQDCGASRECPRCHHLISNSDVSPKWPGFPSGVKFDPSDAELIEHLAAKIGVGNSKPHLCIDEFIPTLDWDAGICYTHPKNLPGAKKDGTSFHLFHKIVNAYSTGQRKPRKIDNEQGLVSQALRWQKTGKTKAVKWGGYPGWKKIMVLYKSSNKGSKADKKVKELQL